MSSAWRRIWILILWETLNPKPWVSYSGSYISTKLAPPPEDWFKSIVLGGSWVVVSRVISRVTILITHIRGLITPLRNIHAPPSSEGKRGSCRSQQRRTNHRDLPCNRDP